MPESPAAVTASEGDSRLTEGTGTGPVPVPVAATSEEAGSVPVRMRINPRCTMDPEKEQLVTVHVAEDASASPSVSSIRRPVAGMGAAVLAAVLMAGYLLLGKQYVSHPGTDGDPAVFLLGRQVVASFLMAAIACKRDGCVLPRTEDRPVLHLLGLLNFVNAVGFVWGFKLTTAFTTSVVQLSIPVLTLALSVAMSLEPLSASKLVGVLLVVCGCALVTAGDSTASAVAGASSFTAVEGIRSEYVLGMAVLFAQCISFVVSREPP